MDEEAVLKKRVNDWTRLNDLTEKASVSFRRLSGEEFFEFVRLYRKASSDLALLSTQTSNVEVIDYLNAIVTKAYGILYKSPSKSLGAAISDSLAISAQTFRKHCWAFVLSFALFFGSSLFAFQLIRARPDLRPHLVPEQMEANFEQWRKGEHEQRKGGESIAMTSLYAQNNPRVGVMINAVSVATFGTLTTYILWQNGSILGALAADMNSVGKLGFLITSIAPHGISEIGGLFVTAAGGFVMAWALIKPGRRSRGEALRIAGKDSFILMMTGLVMIAIAAPIEGFFSFNPSVPMWAKVVFAICALGAWSAYFLGYANTAGQAVESSPSKS